MIITRTPFRLSFLGGSTDYPDSIKRWGGFVVGSSINKYSYITCRRLPKFFDYHTRLMYSKIETVKSNNDIEHRAIKAAIKVCGLNGTALEVSHMADLPSQSGTGSSSTFVVGIVNALSLLNGEALNPYELYQSAINIEQNILKESVGCQDQAWAAFGGMNKIRFYPNGKMEVVPILKTEEEMRKLSSTLIMFFTGISRVSSTIAASYVPTLSDKESEHKELLKLAEEGARALEDGHYLKLGHLMAQSWEIKKSFSKIVTNPQIDEMYEAARDAGAFGGKIMGAGGGGCMIVQAPPGRRDYILSAVNALPIKFSFEPRGSTVIFNDWGSA